ncbi:MAG TPA: large conductance mechanosensitive channel protein MscL [Solirubrobacteraceae bacterium]|jgi:large conductance mechanosensitive channel|nr:large conductance mechanosensitive channel protein MscL [Solirubrobacteraceae bacterium]
MRQFREFLLRGNVVDLAVAVIIGAAFGAVIAALVADIITPLIAAIGGQPDFSGLSFTINGSVFRYGHFLNAVISFLIVAAVVYFLVVKPVAALMERRKAGLEPEPEAVPEDVVLLGEIRDLLKTRGGAA